MYHIYLDFDGTVVEHAYPHMGRFNPGAAGVIKQLQEKGHKIFLNTYRADLSTPKEETEKTPLEKAQEYLQYILPRYLTLQKDQDEFEYKFETLSTKVGPFPFVLNDELQIYTIAEKTTIFLDDHSTGMPISPTSEGNSYMVDWVETERILKEAGIL